MPTSSKIAFIFSQFPCYDETFILREMNELRAAGLGFEIYSLKACKDKIIHEEAKGLARDTSYLPFFSLKLLACDLFFLFRCPGRYFAAFFQALFFNLKSPNFFFKTCALWYKAVGFARLAREHGITHVHGQWATYPATVAFIISKLNDIPFSFTGHAHDIYLDTTMLAFKIKHAKFVVTCTADNKRHLIDIVAETADKIIVNYHGVNMERFRNEGRGTMVRLRSPQADEGRKFKILSVGTLGENKGFNYLIDACGILKERGIEFECTIAGGGPLEASLKALTASHGLSEAKPLQPAETTSRLSLVRFTGYITQEKLVPMYKEADVFALAMVPEKHWGIPNVLIEAMAASAPVVCTMLPSIPELVEDGKNGFIIPAKDPFAIAVAIEKLYQDPALRKRMGETGRRVVEEKFDRVKNVVRLKELFEAV